MALHKFDSFEEQRQADIRYYRSLSPKQRLEIFRQLQQLVYGAEERWPSLSENIHLTVRSRTG
ncbi:MAG: hypothetical protein ACE5MK_13260 [Acidobacteriota bacterium]